MKKTRFLDGREIATLNEGIKSAGKHQIIFIGNKLSTGVYFIMMNTEKISRTI
jgi:hypothetical protein